MELDPVGVEGMPTTPCPCGTGCSIARCEPITVARPAGFLMNAFERDGQLYWMSLQELGRVSVKGVELGSGNGIASINVPSRVVVDAGFAYFSSYQGLWKVRRDASDVTLSGAGSGASQLLATLSPWPIKLTEIAVDTRDLYWTSPGNEVFTTQLKRTPVAGGTSVTLARLPSDDDWPLGLAVDDSDVYFTSNAALQRISKAGGEVRKLEPIGAHVAFDSPHPMLGIALDRDYVYFDAGKVLERRSKQGADSVALFELAPGDQLQGVVVDAFYAFFATKSGGIYRVPKRGGAVSLLVSGERNPLVTAVDSTSVYWVEQDLGEIRRASK
jgi:hypothetical protein